MGVLVVDMLISSILVIGEWKMPVNKTLLLRYIS